MKTIKSYIRSGKKEVDDYIVELEKFNGDNIQRLVQACNDVAGVIADDVVRIASSTLADDELDNQLLMLGSKKNKIYERFLSLIGNMKNFKALSDFAKQEMVTTLTKEDIKPKKEEEEDEPEFKGEHRNVFEQATEKIKLKLNGAK